MARWWILAVLAACYDLPDYRGTHFACKHSSLCPEGMLCSEDHCVLPSSDELLIDQRFVITRDPATPDDYAACVDAGRCPSRADAAAGEAYCAFVAMRLPTEDELRAAGLAADPSLRCARSVP